jgi:ribosomal protein S18 acetylase RimI-like enzyme
MDDDCVKRVKAASNPRRATPEDALVLSQLFASAFRNDPIIDFMVRTGPRRAAALEEFFHFLLHERDIQQGEVWMSSDGHACTMWSPPGASTGAPGGFVQRLRLLPAYLRIFGFARLGRCSSIVGAMKKNHPTERHFYLAFMAVSPQYQGAGLGSAILAATLKRIDDAGVAAYLENSNPKNTRLYQRAGFVAQKNILPDGVPPLVAMWRAAPVA